MADPGFPRGASTTEGGVNLLLPPANVVCEGYIFTGVCDSVNRGGMHGCSGGGYVVAPRGSVCGCSGGGHASLLQGGVCGCLGGHVWFLLGGCVWFLPGGMHGFYWGRAWFLLGGHAWFLLGGHVWFFPGGACVGYDEIRSVGGRYASYWNAFLFSKIFAENGTKMKEIGVNGK